MRKRIENLVTSIVLAYPLSGCMVGIADLTLHPSPLAHPVIWFLEVVWFMVATTLYGGFPFRQAMKVSCTARTCTRGSWRRA